MSYFEDGDTVPPPFNMIPTGKSFSKIIQCGKSGRSTRSLIVRAISSIKEINKILLEPAIPKCTKAIY